MNMQPKTPSESKVIMTEIVLPNDTNALHNLRGGKILHWMDIASAIAAGKHSNSVVVTASVDNVSFENPIKLGDVVTITAKVTRVFNTSLETHIEVWAENLPSQTRYRCNEAYYTFVALDSNGRPRKVPPLIPETEEEIRQYEGALRRRELRLVLAGRLKPSDAKELRALFAS
ncbi:MAG: acyl-CoA thioesterase [Chitinophagales bacterium]|nr:acyl-CoA thioesterase [Chitinophagales bacterium]MDW8274289.1 acyl-CoA thioesterase [Chitinophagales bacterium]